MAASDMQSVSRHIDAVFAHAGRISSSKEEWMDEVLADYARYLCVLITGFLERSVARILQEYADDRSDTRVSSYINRSLRLGRNMRVDNMLVLVGDFDEKWQEILSIRLTEEHRQAIGDLYTHRNKIVHGEDSDLSFYQVQEAYRRIRQTVDFLEEIVSLAP